MAYKQGTVNNVETLTTFCGDIRVLSTNTKYCIGSIRANLSESLLKAESLQPCTPSAEHTLNIMCTFAANTSVADFMWTGCQLQQNRSRNAEVNLYTPMGHSMSFTQRKAPRVCKYQRTFRNSAITYAYQRTSRVTRHQSYVGSNHHTCSIPGILQLLEVPP